MTKRIWKPGDGLSAKEMTSLPNFRRREVESVYLDCLENPEGALRMLRTLKKFLLQQPHKLPFMKLKGGLVLLARLATSDHDEATSSDFSEVGEKARAFLLYDLRKIYGKPQSYRVYTKKEYMFGRGYNEMCAQVTGSPTHNERCKNFVFLNGTSNGVLNNWEMDSQKIYYEDWNRDVPVRSIVSKQKSSLRRNQNMQDFQKFLRYHLPKDLQVKADIWLGTL